MKRKLLAVTLVVIFCICLIGCSTDEVKNTLSDVVEDIDNSSTNKHMTSDFMSGLLGED